MNLIYCLETTTSKDKLWEIVKDYPSIVTNGFKKITRRVKESETNVEDVMQWIKAVDDAGEEFPRFASVDMEECP